MNLKYRWSGDSHRSSILRTLMVVDLIRMRRGDPTTYRIPYGGGFRWVTCPNYLGEIIEWSGWALASRSPAGLAFAVFTFANLAPRALAHHRWYHDRFPAYPSDRKALIPFLL